MANEKNLKPPPSPELAREMGAKGGKAAAESKRKKKLMSELYAEFLADKFDVKVDGQKQSLTGEKLVSRVVKEILIRGGAPAVSLMKEIREATEGNKVKVEGGFVVSITPLDESL